MGAGRVAVDLGAGTGKFLALLARTDASLVAATPELAGRDSVAFPYATHAYWRQRVA